MNKMLEAVRYALEKYQSFAEAQTSEERLAALWHVSQLVHLLPDELIEQVIQKGIIDPDFRVRLEICYLLERWRKPEKAGLLRSLKNDSNPEVLAAFGKLQTKTPMSVQGEQFEMKIRFLWTDLFRLVKQRDVIRIGQFIATASVAGGVLLVSALVFFIVGIISDLPMGLTVALSYVFMSLGIEGIFVALVLYWKQRIAGKDEN